MSTRFQMSLRRHGKNKAAAPWASRVCLLPVLDFNTLNTDQIRVKDVERIKEGDCHQQLCHHMEAQNLGACAHLG